MSTGRYSFKGTDAARLMRAARAAGLAVKSVELRNGAVTLQVEDGVGGAKRDEPNDWAGVLKDNAADEKRTP
jgi:hypothetical protein